MSLPSGKFETKNLSIHSSWNRALPEEITPEEKRLIMEGSLGYCEAHTCLYRKASREELQEHGMSFGLSACLAWIMACKCDDPDCDATLKIADIGPCREWGSV